MSRTIVRPPAWSLYLRLGRVSNLPTVWSNCLAGATIALSAMPSSHVVGVAAAVSLLYCAGMFLNDAFDANHDRLARPERPIPSGWIERRRVMAIGFALLAAGVALVPAFVSGGSHIEALAWGTALAALIVYYDWRHKRDPLSAVVMALCRALVYVVAGATVAATLPSSLVIAAGALAAYVTVLTQIAKRDLVPGKYIAFLISGISLVDAALIASITGRWDAAAIAAIGCPATLLSQRIASGT